MKKDIEKKPEWTGRDAVKFVKQKAKELNMTVPQFLTHMRIGRTTYWRWKNGGNASDDVMFRVLVVANSLKRPRR